nr:hypothetical protein [Sphingomonas sp. CDS-1]
MKRGNAMQSFGEALRLFRDATAPTVPSQVVQAFFAVASDEGKSLSDYAASLGTNMSTASRQLLDLGSSSPRAKGFGLVVAKENPADLRQKGFWLSDSGRDLAKAMEAALNA